MKKLNLLAVVACIGLAFGLTSCKDEKKLVGSWEVVKSHQIETYKGDALPDYYKNRDTIMTPGVGESTVLTFSKKGVVLIQETQADGNSRSYTDAYTILDDKLYFMNQEYTMSFKGKELTLASEKTEKKHWYSYDYEKNENIEVPYTYYTKIVTTLKEH